MANDKFLADRKRVEHLYGLRSALSLAVFHAEQAGVAGSSSMLDMAYALGAAESFVNEAQEQLIRDHRVN